MVNMNICIDKNMLIAIGILAIALMEIIAIVYLHLDGFYLSAAVGSISFLITYKYQEVRLNGRNKFDYRYNDRRNTSAT